MRKLLIKIHLYGGLLCAPYLVIFATSSLNFNHHFDFMAEPEEEALVWEQALEIPSSEDKKQLANAIRDSLGLMGWPLRWTFKEDNQNFRFEMVHFGKKYEMQYSSEAALATIKEQSRGFWHAFNALHFLSENVPNAPWWVGTWKYYQDFCVVFIFFSIATGIYLWAKRSSERLVGTVLITIFVIISLILINYLWLAA